MNGTRNACTDSPVVCRETEISRALYELREMVERHGGISGRINERLHPVLSQERPMKEESMKDKTLRKEYTSPLANDIDNIRRILQETADGLENLYSRIEL